MMEEQWYCVVVVEDRGRRLVASKHGEKWRAIRKARRWLKYYRTVEVVRQPDNVLVYSVEQELYGEK